MRCSVRICFTYTLLKRATEGKITNEIETENERGNLRQAIPRSDRTLFDGYTRRRIYVLPYTQRCNLR